MWDVSIERTPSSLQIVRLGGGPLRIWTATQGRDLVIEAVSAETNTGGG